MSFGFEASEILRERLHPAERRAEASNAETRQRALLPRTLFMWLYPASIPNDPRQH
jgi:hypothetical protein